MNIEQHCVDCDLTKKKKREKKELLPPEQCARNMIWYTFKYK